ncbi:MAG: iron-sulfur cluster assembly scaffold protein [Candidatus Pacebacteria bacterium]|nr:iron-sulfur cluster assembly scaffold protein [Candidatus Paceibacterota bacterium]MDD2756988.1 iron-sulfur cluster assembly scaffold protein [Candidatus Paceibacterota bacterium]MDD3283498.1 iron-sulfur cluster assembly scaffold protein [Candidatus Paceibacterota bacterium]MDD3969646.1 iron-sulfur cluster assembly scaffold protein [Candidatus Paceibacterota bacterium]MDD4737876.1 iron-sulfur cluster assembly scaffold protein [Candidatus Paceibacterota bacterium]
MNYSKEVLKHFSKPHNYGKIDNYDGLGRVGNMACGDEMFVYIKVKDNIIKDIKFETFGCVAAIATSSVLTDLAKKKTIEDALKITKQDVVDALGALPPIKIHCSVLAIDALTQAVYDYYIKNKIVIPKDLEERHNQITKRESCHS